MISSINESDKKTKGGVICIDLFTLIGKIGEQKQDFLTRWNNGQNLLPIMIYRFTGFNQAKNRWQGG
jgi:hypothetical protein